MTWIQSVQNLLRSGTVVSIVSGLVTTGSYVYYKDYSRYRRMMDVYSSGNILAPLAENNYEIAYCPRDSIEDYLNNALRCNFTNQHYLVNGEVGCGKTRTIVELVRKLMVTCGQRGEGAPVYVLATQGTSFPETLAEAVNFYFDEHISHKFLMDFVMRVSSFPRQDSESRLTRVLDAIEVSSFLYMQKYGRPVVLVIDGVENLTASMPGALDKMMEKAKLWADTNTVKIIFVNNDEEVEVAMQKNCSFWSRAAEPIVIDDLTREEALAFLTSSVFMENVDGSSTTTTSSGRRMPTEVAEEIYNYVGGRIVHLIAFKRNFFASTSPDHFSIVGETLEQLKRTELEKFLMVYRKPGLRSVVLELAEAPNRTMKVSKAISLSSEADVHALTKMKIIRIDAGHAGAQIRFFSTLTEHVVVEASKIRALRKQKELQQQHPEKQFYPLALAAVGAGAFLTLFYWLSDAN